MRGVFLGLAAACGALAQNVTFRADSRLVLTGFHAMRGDDFIRDLRPEEIVILEDGEPRPVAAFEGGIHFRRSLPMRMVLLFDCSNSVRASGLLNPKVFEPSLLAGFPQVSVGIYGFTHVTRPLAEPTRRMGLLEAALEEVLHFPPGLTRLYEAILETVGRLAEDPTPATRAIVVFSDGMAPPDAQPEAIRAARAHDIALYPVVLARNPKDLFAAPGRLNPFEKTVKTFVALAPPTGGRQFQPKWSQKNVLGQILDVLVEQAGREYVAGYYASEERDARPRKVEIKLRSPERGEIRGGERTVAH